MCLVLAPKFLLFRGITAVSSLYSFILQDNTPLCLIFQAAYLQWIHQRSNEPDRGYYLSPRSTLSSSLAFTIGFRSIHKPAVIQDHNQKKKAWFFTLE